MNMHDLIMSTDDRGRIGFRGEHYPQFTDDKVVYTPEETSIQLAFNLGLIHLLAAWRSSEDNDPNVAQHDGYPIDRRVYGLTNKGWAYKITGGTDHLQNYLVSVMADAELAHWGTKDIAVGLRFPESSFDKWENPLLVGDYNTIEARVLAATPKHQHPYGLMPNTTIDPPLVLGPDLTATDVRNRKLYDTPTGGDLDWPLPPYPYPVPSFDYIAVFIGVILALLALTGIGWWLS